jgi:predicted enzyme related to lactoylglutathione lyase
MAIDQLLAVVPVSDMQAAQPWYERLIGQPEDNYPMHTLCEWKVATRGWLQIFLDPERAGSSMISFAVDDLDKHIFELGVRGLISGEIETANKGVRLSTIFDLDGNRITFIGGFRNVY